ncbi:MAG: plasmid pRiA4b ORF-3 family protein, partial [Proteobacteria bacterium]|nr:plasmid pRiA4b ORF-3 family protein [Pseudomonadota bacterium]
MYQLKITLTDSKPPIWRRILVSSETTLSKLHDIIQIAMGWTD